MGHLPVGGEEQVFVVENELSLEVFLGLGEFVDRDGSLLEGVEDGQDRFEGESELGVGSHARNLEVARVLKRHDFGVNIVEKHLVFDPFDPKPRSVPLTQKRVEH